MNVSRVVVKTCNACGVEKELSKFHKDATIKCGYRGKCIECRDSHRKKVYDKEANREWWLRSTYGISISDYDRMLEEQDNSCAICNTHISTQVKNFHVDHCHTTGKVRGLLCSKCNTGLGMYNDDPELFKSAIKYLEDL